MKQLLVIFFIKQYLLTIYNSLIVHPNDKNEGTKVCGTQRPENYNLVYSTVSIFLLWLQGSWLDFNKDDNIHKQRSSFAFCSLTDRPTDKIFTEQMLIDENNLQRKKSELYLHQKPRKSRFPLNLTDDTDICIFREASVLKSTLIHNHMLKQLYFPYFFCSLS